MMEDSSIEQDNGDNLQPSELGTKEYWNAVYERDKVNYENHGDVGEVWFGEDSELRILRWLQMNVDVEKRIIDLGCGNGMMLVELAREGYKELTGTDYSRKAIDLCKNILQSQSFDKIKLMVLDLTEDCHNLRNFNVALDKGTYDAISLNPDNATAKKKKYIKNVSEMLTTDGFFIVTSCNWTEKELIRQISSEFNHFQTIPTPSFSFGGKVGNIISSVVFKKK
ncbi:EEF1A lysine methyltransferase 2 [Rhodnius prolixus]|uniref:Protein-lysine N-methyltransferase n=1 Tax=Rhodnius prolixus TaxID=13249 RepID=R4G432_RHOPR